MSRLSCLMALPLLATAGCHSAYVEATVENHSGTPVRLVEVDYPSASFGVGSLAPGARFSYRFKLQGSGAIKLEFTDAGSKVHNASGPLLKEGEQGRLLIRIDADQQVHWQF